MLKHVIIVIESYVFLKLLLMYNSVNSVRSHEIRLAPGRDIFFFIQIFFFLFIIDYCFFHLIMDDIVRMFQELSDENKT